MKLWLPTLQSTRAGRGPYSSADPMQLLGLPPHPGLMFQATEEQYMQGAAGALFGIPALGVDSHMFIYTSDYYKGLIKEGPTCQPYSAYLLW